MAYATTKFEVEISYIDPKLPRLLRLCNTESDGQTARKSISPVHEADRKSISLSYGMVRFYFGVVYIHQLDNSWRYPLLRTLQLPKIGCLS